MSQSNIINLFNNLLNTTDILDNNDNNNHNDIITKLHDNIQSVLDIDKITILLNSHAPFINIHIISEILCNWCINTNEKFQIYFIKKLYEEVDFQSLNINFNTAILTLQKLLTNKNIKDEIVIQALQEHSYKDLGIIYFTTNQRKISMDKLGIYSNCTLLEIVAKEIRETHHQNVIQRLLKLFNYLLHTTKHHVNVYNIYAILVDLYYYNSFQEYFHFQSIVKKFFIVNNQDFNQWKKSLKFYNKLIKTPFKSAEELKNIIIEFCSDFDNDNISFLLMTDHFNQNVFSYCRTRESLESLMNCDWIPNVLKQEYKNGFFYRICNYYSEKINCAFYMSENLQNSLDKLLYMHFFLLNIPNEVKEQLKTMKNPNGFIINDEIYNNFINIVNIILPNDLCKIIYNKIN